MRYRASLVDQDQYLLICQRYIELNPVRAGMVSRPDDYRWSSYRYDALNRWDPVVTAHAVYRSLASRPGERCVAYRRLFSDVIDAQTVDEVRQALNHNHILGGPRFLDQIQAMLGRRLSNGRPGRPAKAYRQT